MIAVTDLPGVNAILNGTAAVLLALGYTLIRQRKIEAHRKVMLAAFARLLRVSGELPGVPLQRRLGAFPEQGAIRTIYFTVLLTHTVLAATVPPLAIITLRRGLAARYDIHRRIARWTLPIWLYVSVTGVVVYWMLYRM